MVRELHVQEISINTHFISFHVFQNFDILGQKLAGIFNKYLVNAIKISKKGKGKKENNHKMFSLKIFSRTAFQKYQDPNHHLINSTLHFPTHNLSNWQSQFLCTPKFHKNLKGKRPRAIFCHMLLCYSPTLIPLCDCFSLTKWLHCSHWWFCFSICSEVLHTLQDILYHLAMNFAWI